MEAQEIKESLGKYQKEIEQLLADVNKRHKDIEAKGFESADWKELFENRNKAADALEEKHVALVKELEETKARTDVLETAARRPKGDDGEHKSQEQIEHKEALDDYLLTGEKGNLRELEKKVIQVGSDPDGGYALQPDVEAGIIGRVRESSPMRQEARVISIRSNQWRTNRITGHATSGGWVSEQGTRSATTTPTIGQVVIDLHEQFAMPTATQQSLEDLELGVEPWLAEEVEAILGITENTSYFSGVSGRPRGILTYTDGTDDTDMEVEQIPSTVADNVSAGGLIDLQDALFEPYQANAKFYMRRATRSTLRQLADGETRFRLQMDFSAPGASTILGKPVVLCADMESVGAGNLAIAYADMRQAYVIVDKPGIRVIRDNLTSKPNILFYSVKRTGGGIVKPQAIKLQDIAAS